MLELKEIGREYRVGGRTTVALDGINLAFRTKEFVAILGPSGSGKTTCLNLIGGLDQPDYGEMIFRGVNTGDFTDSQWDSYRSNSIGFIFQNFNLLNHLTIVENVALAMMMSGERFSKSRDRARAILRELGLGNQLYKKPNQLSNGQQQKVAIARALVTDPDILLCDEPTGSLDYADSEEIMGLIQKESRSRLVILVTHNAELADMYADRIITFREGRVASDSKPYNMKRVMTPFRLKKSCMNFSSALLLGFRELLASRWEALLIAVACSAGIVSLMLSASLSTGIQGSINNFESDTIAEYPVVISSNTTSKQSDTDDDSSDTEDVEAYDASASVKSRENILSDDYMKYLKKMNPDICSSIAYIQPFGMNLLRMGADGQAVSVSVDTSDTGNMTSDSDGLSIAVIPESMTSTSSDWLDTNYDLLAGEYPSADTDLCLVVDAKNRVPTDTIKSLGVDTSAGQNIPYDQLAGMELRLIGNDDYYMIGESGYYTARTDYQELWNLDGDVTLRISGIIRAKQDAPAAVLKSGIAYGSGLVTLVTDRATSSKIVITQRSSGVNVLTGEVLDEPGREKAMAALGARLLPDSIIVYPTSFDTKTAVLAYLDKYNSKVQKAENMIYYTDLSAKMTSSTNRILGEMATGLRIFSIAALAVTFVLIFMLIYSSINARTREIGVFRALGARRKDIVRVVDAKTFLLGLISGLLGTGAAYVIITPVNNQIYKAIGLKDALLYDGQMAFYLVLFSIILTIAAGHPPARSASSREPAEALRRG